MKIFLKSIAKILSETSIVLILIFVIYLIVGRHVNVVNWFAVDPNWVTAFFTGLSTVAILLTAYWAKKSFWYTSEKDRIDRTVDFIEKIYFTELANDIRIIVRFLEKEDPVLKDCKNGATWDEINEKYTPKIQNVLNRLNLFGVLLRYKKVNLQMFYDVFHSDMRLVWDKCKFMFDDMRKKDSRIWEDFNYLHDKFLELDKINKK